MKFQLPTQNSSPDYSHKAGNTKQHDPTVYEYETALAKIFFFYGQLPRNASEKCRDVGPGHTHIVCSEERA